MAATTVAKLIATAPTGASTSVTSPVAVVNGQIGGYAGVRRSLAAQRPDALFAERRGATDSERLFLMALARIDAGLLDGACRPMPG